MIKIEKSLTTVWGKDVKFYEWEDGFMAISEDIFYCYSKYDNLGNFRFTINERNHTPPSPDCYVCVKSGDYFGEPHIEIFPTFKFIKNKP